MSDFENHYYEEEFGCSPCDEAMFVEPIECKAQTLRTCPRCGAKLFEDMSTCYGCLYDFEQNERVAASWGANPLQEAMPIPQGDDELWGSLDEIIPEAQPVRRAKAPALPRMPRTIKLVVGDTIEIISGESTFSIKAIR